MDSGGKLTFTTSALPAGHQDVVLLVEDGVNLPTAVTRHVFVDTAPDAPVVAIQPANPHHLDAISAVIQTDASDADRVLDPKKAYRFQWLNNGVATSWQQATLPAGTAMPGETWSVEVRAEDGYTLGPAGVATATIANLPPILVNAAVVPQNPTVADVLYCTLPTPATDPDGARAGGRQAGVSGDRGGRAGACRSRDVDRRDFAGF